MALEQELATYNAKLPELKEHEGQYALIQGSEVVGVFSTYEDAIKIGYDKFQLAPFLVKQIDTLEQAQFVSRFADPCASRSA
jgi:hypothetical protein